MGLIKSIINKLIKPTGEMRTSGGSTGTYKLDSSKVEYELARSLYQNKHESYKLGAAFIKPIINSTTGFMGVPHFQIEDEEANAILESFALDNTSKMLKTHTDALKLGDCYVWLTREERQNPLYPDKPTRLIYNFIAPDEVKDIILDPTTNEPIAYILETDNEWTDIEGNKKKCKIKQAITAEERIIEVEGDMPEGLEAGSHPNTWGFIPIVHFKNEPDETLKYGQSEIEPIEPYVKAYHDVMLHALKGALKGSKMHSTPKLQMKLKDVAGFLKNNFGVEDPIKFAKEGGKVNLDGHVKFAKEGGKVNLDGHEILFLADGEDAQFLEVNSSTGDAQVLLKLLFYCIVDISETPEFVFGVHTPSSLASTKEQMPIMVNKIRRKREQFTEQWQFDISETPEFVFGVHTPSSLASTKEQMPIMVNKIRRKREQFTEQWQLLSRMVLIMSSNSTGYKYSSYDVTIGWDEINPKDEKESAETLEKISNAISKALESGIISEESAVNFLSQYIDTMSGYISNDPEIIGEREKIIKTKMLRYRLDDVYGLDDEVDDIQKTIDKIKDDE